MLETIGRPYILSPGNTWDSFWLYFRFPVGLQTWFYANLYLALSWSDLLTPDSQQDAFNIHSRIKNGIVEHTWLEKDRRLIIYQVKTVVLV